MFKIKVPATTANIGPGFDCLGIALNLYNTFYIGEIDNGLIIEGCPEEFKNEDNLVYTTMMKCFNRFSYEPKGIKINFQSNIPIGSGLGSSSTCILAGVVAAINIALKKFDADEILNIATEIEGHCDNLTPALLGGLTIAINKDKVYYKKFNIPKNIVFFSLTPDFSLSTSLSRSVLPETINFKDAVFNIGSASMVLASLIKGDLDTLSFVCEDRIHEDYRAKLIPDFYSIKNKCCEFGAIATYISGAGPTIMSICEKDNIIFRDYMNNYLKSLELNWTVRRLTICNTGLIIKNFNRKE